MTTLSAPSADMVRPNPKPLWVGGNMPIARLGLIINLLIPAVLLIVDAQNNQLGAKPVSFAIHTTGVLAVGCLLLSLFVTPIRQFTSWNWLVQFRRSLGVYAFYYGCAHLALYFWFDRGGDLASTVHEITHRTYLAIGFACLALMLPLWATSFNAAIRAMGGARWKLLHRLAYLAAGLACYHYYLQSKADKRIPNIFIATLAGLLVWRIVAAVKSYARAPAKVQVAGNTIARFWKGQLHVVAMFNECHSIKTFRLGLPEGGPLPFTYRAGQFLNLTVDVDGKKFNRSYTIASPPTRDRYIELTIKREENGRVSRFLHDMLMTGQPVSISAPSGRFTFDPFSKTKPADAVILLAGGVGITPVMSILRDLTDRSWPGKIDLIFSVRTPADVIFREELDYLAHRYPNLHVHLTITREASTDWNGNRGRIDAALIRKLVPDAAARPAFVCGPDAMARQTKDELLAIGLPASRITLESFTPASAPVDVMPIAVDSSTTHTLNFASSDRSAEIPSNKTVLDVAESIGVKIDSECRSGICGTCRCRLLDGRVTMANRDALSDDDEAAGYILACQARALEDLSVEA